MIISKNLTVRIVEEKELYETRRTWVCEKKTYVIFYGP